MTETHAEQQAALDQANTALIECLELFKTIRQAELDELDVCVLTLATIGQRIADQASDVTLCASRTEGPERHVVGE